jgi:hypothetical protein
VRFVFSVKCFVNQFVSVSLLFFGFFVFFLWLLYNQSFLQINDHHDFANCVINDHGYVSFVEILFICPFSFRYCIVCPSVKYGF